MMIFTPQKRRQFDLAPESFNFDFVNHPSFTQSSPILANPSSLMMSAMFSSNTFGDFLNSQPIGPAEAFFPCASDPVHAVETDSDLVDEYYQDEEEDSLRLDDFIVGFGDSDSEASGDDRDESTSSPVKEPKDGSAQDDRATPSRPRAISSASARSDTSGMHPLLSHFGNNSDAVGAFRRHQINQQLISSAKASQESLAFSGPLTYGTLRGIKNGSMSTVTSPLTPARKRKVKNGASVREENTLSWDTGSILDSPSCVMARKREGADDEELFLADGRVAKRIRHDTSDQFDMI